MLDINAEDTSRIKKTLFNFIWNKKQDKIKIRGMPCAKTIVMEAYVLPIQTLAWISRLVVTDEIVIESWKSIPTHFFFFQKYRGLNFLLHCNHDSKFLKESEISCFYRQILANFLELRTLYQYNGQDLILFKNKDILINGKSFFLPEWKEKRVVFIKQNLTQNLIF